MIDVENIVIPVIFKNLVSGIGSRKVIAHMQVARTANIKTMSRGIGQTDCTLASDATYRGSVTCSCLFHRSVPGYVRYVLLLNLPDTATHKASMSGRSPTNVLR